MAISVVQRIATSGTSSAGDKTLAFASNVTAGNAILAIAFGVNNTGSFTPSDNVSDSFASLKAIVDASDFVIGQISLVKSAVGGATTVTIGGSANMNYSIHLYEISGLNTTQPFEGATNVVTSFTTPITTSSQSYGAVGTTGLALGVFYNNGNAGAYTLGTGYSNLLAPANINGICSATEEKAVSGAGSTTASIAFTLNGVSGGLVLVLSDTAVGGATTSTSSSTSTSVSTSSTSSSTSVSTSSTSTSHSTSSTSQSTSISTSISTSSTSQSTSISVSTSTSSTSTSRSTSTSSTSQSTSTSASTSSTSVSVSTSSTSASTSTSTTTTPGLYCQGPLNPHTEANDVAVGTVDWSFLSNVEASDGAFATYADTGTAPLDSSVKIVKAGSVAGTDKSTGSVWGAQAYITYGSSVDLWGTTWTAADINDSGFGVAVSATISGKDGSSTSHYLKATNFGFVIPTGSLITGITAEIQRGGASLGGGTVQAGIDHIRMTVCYDSTGGTSTSTSSTSTSQSTSTSISTSSTSVSTSTSSTSQSTSTSASTSTSSTSTSVSVTTSTSSTSVSASTSSTSRSTSTSQSTSTSSTSTSHSVSTSTTTVLFTTSTSSTSVSTSSTSQSTSTSTTALDVNTFPRASIRRFSQGFKIIRPKISIVRLRGR